MQQESKYDRSRAWKRTRSEKQQEKKTEERGPNKARAGPLQHGNTPSIINTALSQFPAELQTWDSELRPS
jgi:hypothetical protein